MLNTDVKLPLNLHEKEEEVGGVSKIFFIIFLFSYRPRQNIRCIEGSIYKKKVLRKEQYCRQESGQTVSGAF